MTDKAFGGLLVLIVVALGAIGISAANQTQNKCCCQHHQHVCEPVKVKP